MKILYLSLSYVPSRRASSVHVMKMCAALARQGHQVRLVTKGCPERQEGGVANDYQFYGVEPQFGILKLPRPDTWGGGLLYALAMWRLLRAEPAGSDRVVYARDLLGAWLASRRHCRLVLEVHGVPSGPVGRRLFRSTTNHPNLERIVVISQALEDRLQSGGLLPPSVSIVVAHDGADKLEQASRDDNRPTPAPGEARRARIGYVGGLYPGRGIEIISLLSQRLPQFDFHVIGGNESDLRRWRHAPSSENLKFDGFRPPSELPGLYKSFDVLLMPYQHKVGVASGKTDTSSWMSPMKMFEYMAAGVPIVASDLPVLQEVLENGRNALLVPPDEPKAWEAAILRLVGDPGLAAHIAETAESDLTNHYTWDARARSVLDGL